MSTINENTNPVSAVLHAVTGGKFRVRLTTDEGPGRRDGYVLDDSDNIIGSASDATYNGRGFAVHTKPYAGYVPEEDIIFVQTREQMEQEVREIVDSYSKSITPEKQRRVRELLALLNASICRTCSKKYDKNKTRADIQGFCSAKCQHQKAKECGYKKSGIQSEFNALKMKGQVGSVHVIR